MSGIVLEFMKQLHIKHRMKEEREPCKAIASWNYFEELFTLCNSGHLTGSGVFGACSVGKKENNAAVIGDWARTLRSGLFDPSSQYSLERKF